MRAVLVGNYGVGNFGDEALKDYFLSAFPEVEWLVLSANPKAGEYPRLPGGIRSFCTTPWWRTIGAMRRSQAVVFGGGSLLTDVESSYACFLWWLHAAVARILGKPILFSFQGVGPFRTKRGEWLARSALRKSTFISVRDASSFHRCRTFKLNTKIVQTSDPVFLLFLDKKPVVRTQNLFAVIPRHTSSISFDKHVKKLLSSRVVKNIVILSFQPNDAQEQEVCKRLQLSLKQESVSVHIQSIASTHELAEVLGRAEFLVSQRFHGSLAALAWGVPQDIVPQEEGDKLSVLQSVAPHGTERMQKEAEEGQQALNIALGQLSVL